MATSYMPLNGSSWWQPMGSQWKACTVTVVGRAEAQ